MELNITLEKSCYFPGELLKCLVKVVTTASVCGLLHSHSLPQRALTLTQVKRTPDSSAATPDVALELFFECSGSERVDPSWVGRLHHPEVTAQKDNKVWQQQHQQHQHEQLPAPTTGMQKKTFAGGVPHTGRASCAFDTVCAS